MKHWAIRITDPARKDLTKMPRQDASAVIAALERLALDPYACNIKKLAATEDEWRLRVGQWRVRFRFLDAIDALEVLHVVRRGSAYRDL